MKNLRGKIAGLKYITAVPPIVLLMTMLFFVTVRREIINISEERLSLIAQSYSYNISVWAGNVLSELGIYKDIAEAEGKLDSHTFGMLAASSGVNSAYLYGIYWGDENGNYFDSSGWMPDADFVPSQRRWYTEGLEHSEFTFGEPYLDAMTGNICVSATVKLNCGGAESVMAADVYLDYASGLLSRTKAQEIDHAFIISNSDRTVLASTDSTQTGQVLGSEGDSELYRSIDALLAEGFTGQTVVNSGGRYYVNVSGIENTDWTQVICISRDTLLFRLHVTETVMYCLSIAACAVIIMFTLRTSKRMDETFRRAKADPLTRLYNRGTFRSFTQRALAEKPKQGVMLVFDMDNFKQINDSFGHPEGDEVLMRFAALLGSFFNRADEITARIGGDEFAVFIGREPNRGELSAVLDKFIARFHDMFDEKYSAQKLSVSIGASYAAKSGGYGELYGNADSALYKAKQNGKNCFYIN